MYLTEDELQVLLTFISNHERNEVPNEIWDLYNKIYDELDED